MVGGEDVPRWTFFCGIPFIKEQIFNQEKDTFLSPFNTRGPVNLCPPASAGLDGSILTSIYGMKVSYMKHLPWMAFGKRWRLMKSLEMAFDGVSENGN